LISKLVLATLGITLFISATLWPHSGPQLLNAWTCGVLLALFAVVLPMGPWSRIAMTSVGLWLLISGMVLPAWSDATVRCHALIGLVLLLLAVAPQAGRRSQRHARLS
jgi:hypothetical protein